MDEHVHDVGLRIETVIKNMLQDHGLGYRTIRMAHKILQERKLARLQLDQLATSPNFATNEVQRQVSDRKLCRLRRLGRAPDECLDAREQLGEGKWLGQIIVTPGLQALDPVIYGSFGAEYK